MDEARNIRYVRLPDGDKDNSRNFQRRIQSVISGRHDKSRRHQERTVLAAAALPRTIPRKLKGRLRKAESYGNLTYKGARFERGRISVHSNYHVLFLDALEKRLRVNSSTEKVPTRRYSSSSAFQHNAHVNDGNESRKQQNMFMEDQDFMITSSNWKLKKFFDVLHLTRPRMLGTGEIPDSLVAFRGNEGYEAETDVDNRNGMDRQDSTVLQQQSEEGLTDEESDAAQANKVSPRNNLEEDDTKLDVFLFPFGCVVLWNFDPEEEQILMHSLKPFAQEEYAEDDLIDTANDDMEFCYAPKSQVRHDTVRLSSRKVEEKLAVSYAFAQSSLLSIYEWRLDKIIQRNEQLPQELALTGAISMSRKEINKEIGRLFMERNSINLESDLLGKPDFFWENDEWDPFYETMCTYLEHEERIEVLDKRMECVHELLDVLTAQAENTHARYFFR